MPRLPLIAALLAGGASRRMGRDKAGVALGDGRTLAQHTLAALQGLGVPVVVVGHARGVDLPPGVDVVADAREDVGPLGGVLALLQSDRADAYAILPVDMPRITTAQLQALVDAKGDALAAVYAPRLDVIAPFPVVIDARARELIEVRVDANALRMRGAIEALSPVVLQIDDAALADVDTPEDL